MEKQSYGLGLAIVKAIAQLHGCQCGVQQETDGLSFWFELPKVEMDSQEESPEEEDWEEDETNENPPWRIKRGRFSVVRKPSAFLL